jgi:hypothetical protein
MNCDLFTKIEWPYTIEVSVRGREKEEELPEGIKDTEGIEEEEEGAAGRGGEGCRVVRGVVKSAIFNFCSRFCAQDKRTKEIF